MVRKSDRKSELSPIETMKRTKVVPAPVSASMPMMTPTSAQATPTGSAFLAPSARLSRQSDSVARPPRVTKLATTRTSDQDEDRGDAAQVHAAERDGGLEGEPGKHAEHDPEERRAARTARA